MSAYASRTWDVRTRLLAVRPFNLCSELLLKNRPSDLLLNYHTAVLSEFDLNTSNLFSATSDGGNDVKLLCKVLLPGLREWCVCHMFNSALVEALRTHAAPMKSTKLARKKVVNVVKVVEHINKYPKAKAK